ncbi:MAG: site-2 protease family protein [bacterium]
MISTIIIFIIVLAVLIVVHELGHFLAARAFGIRVDEFGLGFGPRLFGKTFTHKKHGATIYTLNAIPLGGFVKIFGENPDADSLTGPDSARSFVNKPRWAQAIVLAAGVFFNFLFAWAIVSLGFLGGIPVSPESYPQYANQIQNPHIIVDAVKEGSPAKLAGLTAGDTLLVPSIETLQNTVAQSHGNAITLERITAAGAHSTLSILPATSTTLSNYVIGIEMENAGTLRLPIHLAIWEGGKLTLYMIKAVVVGIWTLIVGAFHGDGALLSQVAGPIGIAKKIGQESGLGFGYLISFVAFISVNLGVLNLVPFPALDGSRILFVAIESVIRRRIKPVIMNTVNGIGFVLLLLLMFVVTYREVVSLIFG